jgi:pilus assembly protein FimV
VASYQPEEEFTYPSHEAEVEAEAERAADLDAARTHVGTFDFEPAPVEHAPAPEPAPAHDDSFDFDLPMHSEETPPPAAPAHDIEPEPVFAQVAEPAAPPRNDDIYLGEDAIGTKLDLAKAYLDMGDPEGARSMLDEVMNEGNDTQKDEARKLLAEIR